MSSGMRTCSLAAVVCMLLFTVAASLAAEESIFVKEGRQLYETICARCHGDIGSTDKAGRSMNRIRSALRRFDQHKEFASLSDEQILLLSMALEESRN